MVSPSWWYEIGLKPNTRHMIRTRMWPQDYTAPIEIDAYEDRVAIISFGKEIFGIVIESPLIAPAIKALFVLADKRAKTRRVTDDHPAPRKR